MIYKSRDIIYKDRKRVCASLDQSISSHFTFQKSESRFNFLLPSFFKFHFKTPFQFQNPISKYPKGTYQILIQKSYQGTIKIFILKFNQKEPALFSFEKRNLVKSHLKKYTQQSYLYYIYYIYIYYIYYIYLLYYTYIILIILYLLYILYNNYYIHYIQSKQNFSAYKQKFENFLFLWYNIYRS